MEHNTNLHLIIFFTLWAYRTSAKTATWFTPFQLIYGLEEALSIECETPYLKLVVELFPNTYVEKQIVFYLAHIDEQCCDVALANEIHKKQVKYQYDKSIWPRVFSYGDFVLVYDQDHDILGEGKFEPLWNGTYIVKCILCKGAYELVYYDCNPLLKPHNGLYLKKYYD
jgi:hypothetical protein